MGEQANVVLIDCRIRSQTTMPTSKKSVNDPPPTVIAIMGADPSFPGAEWVERSEAHRTIAETPVGLSAHPTVID
jgi:hypothetical protein